MIADSTRTHDLSRVIEESQSEGMQSFDQSLMTLLQQGLIGKEEALNNCTNIRDFQLRLEGVVSGEFREKETHMSRQEQVRRILEGGATVEPNLEIEVDGQPEKALSRIPRSPR